MLFGTPPQGQEASDERFAFEHMELPTTFWTPDLDVLGQERHRLVTGIGEASVGQLCDRTSRALGSRLNLEPVVFPGDHTGFMDTPEAFASRLTDVLTAGPSLDPDAAPDPSASGSPRRRHDP